MEDNIIPIRHTNSLAELAGAVLERMKEQLLNGEQINLEDPTDEAIFQLIMSRSFDQPNPVKIRRIDPIQ